MAANAGMNDFDNDFGAELNLDDDALFAELDTEVTLDGSPAGAPSLDMDDLSLDGGAGDGMDFDLGGGDDLEINLDDAGGGQELNLDGVGLGGDDLSALETGGSDGLDDLVSGGDEEPLDLNLEEEALSAGTAAAGGDLDLDSLTMDSLEMPQEPTLDMGAVDLDEAPLTMEDEALDNLALEDEPLTMETMSMGQSEAMEAMDDGFTAVEDTSFDDSDLNLVDLNTAGELDLAGHEPVDFGAAAPAKAAPVVESFTAVQDVDLSGHDVLELNLDAIEKRERESHPVAARAEGGLMSQELLMNIPHHVSVEMGQVALNGRELMELRYGAVVRLDRSVGEPVDLVLEGKTIARGEVVLINGKNLGVRIVDVNL